MVSGKTEIIITGDYDPNEPEFDNVFEYEYKFVRNPNSEFLYEVSNPDSLLSFGGYSPTLSYDEITQPEDVHKKFGTTLGLFPILRDGDGNQKITKPIKHHRFE